MFSCEFRESLLNTLKSWNYHQYWWRKNIFFSKSILVVSQYLPKLIFLQTWIGHLSTNKDVYKKLVFSSNCMFIHSTKKFIHLFINPRYINDGQIHSAVLQKPEVITYPIKFFSTDNFFLVFCLAKSIFVITNHFPFNLKRSWEFSYISWLMMDVSPCK